jgi:hypothetical protein
LPDAGTVDPDIDERRPIDLEAELSARTNVPERLKVSVAARDGQTPNDRGSLEPGICNRRIAETEANRPIDVIMDQNGIAAANPATGLSVAYELCKQGNARQTANIGRKLSEHADWAGSTPLRLPVKVL